MSTFQNLYVLTKTWNYELSIVRICHNDAVNIRENWAYFKIEWIIGYMLLSKVEGSFELDQGLN